MSSRLVAMKLGDIGVLTSVTIDGVPHFVAPHCASLEGLAERLEPYPTWDELEQELGASGLHAEPFHDECGTGGFLARLYDSKRDHELGVVFYELEDDGTRADDEPWVSGWRVHLLAVES